MIPVRTLGLFFGKVVAVYLMGVAAWNGAGADRPYLYAFRETHTQFFRVLGKMGVSWVVVLTEPEAKSGAFDTDLNVLNTVNKTMGTQPLTAQYRGYAPTLLLCSLIMATPFSWARRGSALVMGGLFLHAWTAFGIFLLVLKAYVAPGELTLYQWSDTSRSVLYFITEVISTSTATQFAVPVLVWALVTFRTGDAAALLGIRNESVQSRAPSAAPPQRKARGQRR